MDVHRVTCHACGRPTALGIHIGSSEWAIPVCSKACRTKIGETTYASLVDRYGPSTNLAKTVLTRAEYGRAAWLVLHAVANYYPVKPTKADMRAASDFLTGFATQLPCSMCRRHFRAVLDRTPWTVDSRSAFREWVTKVHNIVNAETGARQIQLLPGKGKFTPGLVYEAGMNLSVVLPDEREFGRAAWLVLHSMAAFYTPASYATVQRFHSGFSKLYPSSTGKSRKLYARHLELGPPLASALESQDSYEAWIFGFHNRVNAVLGKPVLVVDGIHVNAAVVHTTYTCIDGPIKS